MIHARTHLSRTTMTTSHPRVAVAVHVPFLKHGLQCGGFRNQSSLGLRVRATYPQLQRGVSPLAAPRRRALDPRAKTNPCQH